jgi:hypothetical protein
MNDTDQLYHCGCCCGVEETTTIETTTEETTTTPRETTTTTTSTTVPMGNSAIPTACCPISTFYCYDSNTLEQYWNMTENGTFVYSSAFEHCYYGCDSVNGKCNSAPYMVYLYIIAGFLGLLVLFVWLVRK